jgi:hypothetical protein
LTARKVIALYILFWKGGREEEKEGGRWERDRDRERKRMNI